MILQSSSWSNKRRVLARIFLTALIVTVIMIEPRHQHAQSCDIPQGCRAPGKVDLAFILDRSGSLATRGQTWNIMIDGLGRALRNPTVIPRDGSIAVCVVAFDGAANIVVPLTDINSASDAALVAAKVDALRCTGDIHSQIFPCPFGETSFVAGILNADNNVNQVRSSNPKPGARRVLLMVSDGSTSKTDLDQATQLAEQIRVDATLSGTAIVFDAFLLGVNPQSAEFPGNKAALDQIVTPQSVNIPPGVTTVIAPGACNLEGASSPGDDCSRQANEVAENTRHILRSDVPGLSFLVNLEGDTAPGTPPSKQGVSLRQALEAANCNNGGATIAFSSTLRGKTITTLVPLPALAAPDITISGCDPDQPGCLPLLTIDGGGQLADGISVRSNHEVVRGIHLSNFTHAGIAVAPACPSDNTGHNLIDRNVLDNNPTGVLVFDQKNAPRDGFNEANRITQNKISRAVPPSNAPASALIDLGGDGPTANDAGDVDVGPNTLLNFPTSLNVVSSGAGTVTITGQVSGPTVAGATIELFAITASHLAADKLIIDGVTFLAQARADSCPAVAAGGCTFTAAGVPVSPTGNYTATVTDALGNTSELMFKSDGTPAAGPNASFPAAIDFGTVTLSDAPGSKTFEIVNNGNAPLLLTDCTVTRCAPADKDDTVRFQSSGCPGPASPINPGERVTIRVTFLATFCGAAKACLVIASNDLLHTPISVTLTGQVISNLSPAVALGGGASSLNFGPVSPRAFRRGINKVIKKQGFQTFTISNPGCNAFNMTFASVKRVTDVPKCITSANADDSRLWVITQLKSGTETALTPGSTAAISIMPSETLTFRVRFNPAVPGVVSKTCADGTLIADDVLPGQISSVINITATGGGATTPLSVPLAASVTKEVRLINPTDPSLSPLVSLCRSGNDFVVQFSVYDSNQNVDHASFQFMDGSGRTVGQVIDVTGLDQVISARNLATGQSFTIVQRFSGASDNNQVAAVRVFVFDKDNSSDAATSGAVNAACSGVTAQSITAAPAASITLPAVAWTTVPAQGRSDHDNDDYSNFEKGERTLASGFVYGYYEAARGRAGQRVHVAALSRSF
jgi:von Willebrand factor type A domain-containing protein